MFMNKNSQDTHFNIHLP